MEDDKKIETAEEANLKARRKFLKTAAGVAVTAPAVTMLLAGATKSHAQPLDLYCQEGPFVDAAPDAICFEVDVT